jgi:hypothetical protein
VQHTARRGTHCRAWRHRCDASASCCLVYSFTRFLYITEKCSSIFFVSFEKLFYFFMYSLKKYNVLHILHSASAIIIPFLSQPMLCTTIVMHVTIFKSTYKSICVDIYSISASAATYYLFVVHVCITLQV